MHKPPKGFGLIEILLLIAVIGILAGTTVPALQQHNKRSKYRDIVDQVNPVTSIINKCLGLERQITACDSLDKLPRYGYSSSVAAASTLINTLTLEYSNNRYYLRATPPDENTVHPFIDASHTYTRTAEIIDRDGRPVIEEWTTDGKSGCMSAGYC